MGEPTAKRVLVVGAGAVGQVYGRHLALGGADVTFFVREKYVAELSGGMTFYPLHDGDAPVRFEGYHLVTSPEAVRAGGFDQVWLCVSSSALRGDWLGPLLAAAPDALVVAMVPTASDRMHIQRFVPGARLVQGLITFLSYASPLPTETRDPAGTAYWFPPLVASAFDGPEAEVRELVHTLKAGGCPARRQRGVSARASFGAALLIPQLAAMETVGFSFAAFRADPDLVKRASAAGEEALAVVSARLDHAIPFGMKCVNQPFAYRTATSLAPRLAPFDLEAYWAFHFGKVADQTRLLLRDYADDARRHGLPGDALAGLVEELAALDRSERAAGPPAAHP
ncbi:MAG: ketopantoate reductase [Sandaracinaceae bacterium]|nr:ketopantoate reductase [Sandaracinaceae bacterium]